MFDENQVAVALVKTNKRFAFVDEPNRLVNKEDIR